MNNFKEKNFFTYLSSKNISANEITYLKKLYKEYKLFDSYTCHNINKQQLDFLEDKIYTIKGKLLNDFERIKTEILKIHKVFITSDNLAKQASSKYIKEILSLLNKEDVINQPETLFYIKKLITIIQTILDMNITFYYASYCVFMERYRNLELNYDNKLEYKSFDNTIKIKRIKSEEER